MDLALRLPASLANSSLQLKNDTDTMLFPRENNCLLCWGQGFEANTLNCTLYNI